MISHTRLELRASLLICLQFHNVHPSSSSFHACFSSRGSAVLGHAGVLGRPQLQPRRRQFTLGGDGVPPRLLHLAFRIRLYDADPTIIRAFASTGIELVVGLPSAALHPLTLLSDTWYSSGALLLQSGGFIYDDQPQCSLQDCIIQTYRLHIVPIIQAHKIGAQETQRFLLPAVGVISISMTSLPPSPLSSLQSAYLDNNPFDPWPIPANLKDAAALANSANASGELPDVLATAFPSLDHLAVAFNLEEGHEDCGLA